jgi:hypothetical protein
MTMKTTEFDASDPLEEHVPDDAVVDSVRYVGDTEIVQYHEDEYTCDECGESFDSHQELAGHSNAHN